MNKKKMNLLEKAFAIEVDAALGHANGMHIMQTSSKLAQELVDEGYLAPCVMMISGGVIYGFELTDAGRALYCAHCEPLKDDLCA